MFGRIKLCLDQKDFRQANGKIQQDEDVMKLRDCKCLSAGISEQIKDKPVPVDILGEKLVLVRGSDGIVRCLQNVCPHRGAPLHMG